MFLYATVPSRDGTPPLPPTSAPSASRSPQADLDDLMERLARTRLPAARAGRRLGHSARRTATSATPSSWRASTGAPSRRASTPCRTSRPTSTGSRSTSSTCVRAPRCDAAAARAHLPRVIRRLPRPHRSARRPGRARRPRRRRLRHRDFGCPGLRLLEPGRRGRLDHGSRRPAYDELMHRLGYAEYGIHGSDNGALVARELGLASPRASSACTCCSSSRSRAATRRVRAPRAAGLRGTRAHAVVPVGRRLQHHERRAPADRRGRPQRLADGAARLRRALQLVRQRHLARHPRADHHRGQRQLVRECRRGHEPQPTSTTRAPGQSRR